MKINIVLPYENPFEGVHAWATSEAGIDFRKDRFEATRCTVSFAATEVEAHLKKVGCEVSFSTDPLSDVFNLCLTAEDENTDECDFRLKPCDYGLCVIGCGRVGVMYGCYEFLRMQGFRWLYPEMDIVPDELGELNIPKVEKSYSPSMPLGRGFDFEGHLKESQNLWRWMARNRLNLSSYRANTYKLQQKLGMSFKNGGHIFEEILHPDNRTENGKTFWEEHRDWYRVEDKSKASSVQFCTTHKELTEYMAEKLLDCINGEWYYADRIDVWGFDTWGNTCDCEECQKLGNGSDKMLHFLAFLREFINKKVEEGKLDHNVKLVMCSYEGTATLCPPENGVPEILKKSGDYIVYYPINRCYAHEMSNDACSVNQKYSENLSGWKDIPVMMGEYYNVSKLEDLPLVFTKNIAKDLRYYHSIGVSGMTYMHIPMNYWAVRNVTQLLYAQLCWDINTDVDVWLKQYYKDRYGTYADKAEAIYDKIEAAFATITSWRSWSAQSILERLKRWNGDPQEEVLEDKEHMQEGVVKCGEKMVSGLKEALDEFKELYDMEMVRFTKETIEKVGMATKSKIETHEDWLKFNPSNPVLKNIEQDIILMKYGHAMMELMLLFVKYHNELTLGNPCEGLQKELEEKATEASYTMTPMRYPHPRVELEESSLLDRAQLRTLYYRCKQRWVK